MKESGLVMSGNGRTMWEQYSSTFRRGEFLEPEKALLAALLQDAVDCYYQQRAARDGTEKKTLHEAEQWLMSDQDEWLFSFRNVCDLLGLDAQYIRRALLEEKRRLAVEPRRRYKHRRQAA